MAKIKDLVTFQEIKDVIDIDSDVDTIEAKKNIVSEYIISEGLKGHLIDISKNLSNPIHKSIQVIGGYGAGKSHMLAWLVSLLENHELVSEIRDTEVQSEYEKALNRNFAVVQFELQPGASSLIDYFFDRVEQQLEEKHGIKIPKIDTTKPRDYKTEIKSIVEKVKENDPTCGFVVIIDEISDFLKQKIQTQKETDNQFLRILGQVSQSTDFLFIGSMQETVFSSEKYIDDSESFGRVSERFEVITFSREDIKSVISKRVLKKTLSQYAEIDKLLTEYKQTFPPINSNPDEYIEIFPIHPYVIKLFTELHYFQKRGVIQFTMERVRDILDKEFPVFITYDNVFDEINSKHTLRNLDEVRPVIEVIDTLHTKIDLVDERFREDARKIVKALAVLHLYGISTNNTNNGATPEELANQLLITSSSAMKNTDRIIIILDKIREATSGQFIGKSENNYYYLNLEEGPDYDVVISRKAKNLPEGMVDEELLNLIRYNDLIDVEDAESYTRIFKDSCEWADKKSFRLGHFIFDDGTEYVKKGDLDFNLVVRSPYTSSPKISSSKDTAILYLLRDDDLDTILRKLAATRLLIKENYSRGVMQRKRAKLVAATKEKVLDAFLNSEIDLDGNKKRIKSVISRQPDTIDEFFHNIKGDLFNEQFSTEYPKYPKFLNRIAYDNIKGEVDSTLSELIQKGEKSLFSSAKNILSALNLIDIDGNIDITTSIYAKVILDELEKNKGKNVKIDDLVNKLAAKPFGMDKEMILLVVSVLTYNGMLILKKKGGGAVVASDLRDVLKKGVGEYRDIPYATLETEFPVEAASRLFRALELNPGLVSNSKDRTKAVQEFRTKALEIKENLGKIERGIQDISTRQNPIIDTEKLSEKVKELEQIPIEDFLEVKTVSDFKKVEYDEQTAKQISTSLELMASIIGFIKDYNDRIKRDYSYMETAISWMEENPTFFPETDRNPLIEIRTDCKPLILETINVLDAEKRRMLKGKLDQFKRNYSALYYKKHTQVIGDGVDWDQLASITRSNDLRKMRDMAAIKVVNTLNMKQIEERILSIDKAKCTNLLEEHLKDNPYCTWCNFPATLKGIENINEEITKINQGILQILDEWTNLILDEIDSYRDNISLLSEEQQQLIQKTIENRKLPSEISQELITALNNLFSELTEIAISPNEIINYVFSESSVLDYEAFSKKLDEYKEEMLSQGDKKNIRIMRKEG